jgi:hypothetical protein
VSVVGAIVYIPLKSLEGLFVRDLVLYDTFVTGA